MEPLRDVEARLPLPFPMGLEPGTQELTRQFAMADFETRNLTQKYPGIKMVMTEEIIDDWEAQTLNIPF
jgi:hypothetical protein